VPFAFNVNVSVARAPSGFDHVPTTKPNSTRSIAVHPCKKRKDGAPSVGMVHAKIVKSGPPAFQPVYDDSRE
jgi:hypothetical protein